MRSTLTLISLYAVLVVEYVLARIYGGFGPWFMLGATAFLVVYETGAYRSLRGKFSLTRRLSVSRLGSGGRVEVTLEVTIAHSGVLPLQWLRIEDQLPAKLTTRLVQPVLLAHPWRATRVQVGYTLDDVPRGAYRLTGAYITSGDLFGLLTSRVFVPADGYLIAYPQTRQVPRFGTVERSRLGNRVNQARSSDVAARVVGIRDYVQGDRLSRIHWPATARTGALRSKEFEHYVMNEVVLIVDATRASFGQDLASFELALSVAGSLVTRLHESGVSYGVQVFARPYVALPVGKGDLGFVRAMELLAVTEAEGEEPLAETLWRLASLSAQTTTLIITKSLSDEWLRFAVLAQQRQLRVELFLARPEGLGLTSKEEELAVRLHVLGWRIRMIHTLDEIQQLETGWGAYASRP